MRALVLKAYSELEVEQVPDPIPDRDELLIQVAACGICGSDVHGFDGSSGRRIPPLVMGHEAAGTVVAVGEDVERFAPGDRVTFDSTVFCGGCDFCARGEVNLCNEREVLGVSCEEYRRAGAFAELLKVPARIAYHLPDDLRFEEAAMLEAVAVALHAVALSAPVKGKTVLVIGAGMIGLLLLQAARIAGAEHVTVVDVEESRLELARHLGADATARVMESPVAVDVVLEAVGRQETVAMAIEAVRKGGTVTLVGNLAPAVQMPLQKVVSRQIRLQGSCASAGEYPEAMRLIASGQIQVRALISAVGGLNEGAHYFARLHARDPQLMKVVLDPRRDTRNLEESLR